MVNAILKTKEDIQNNMKQYRENNKNKIYELQQKNYKNQHEKTKYCLSRRKGSLIESLKTVQLVNQITD